MYLFLKSYLSGEIWQRGKLLFELVLVITLIEACLLLGYAIKEDFLGFIVSNYPPATDVNDFLRIMDGVVQDLYGALEGRKPTHIP